MANERKKTAGEELWLIHLKRHIPSPEDYDVPKRKRTRSIGEELYQIHLKRSRGVSFDTNSLVQHNHDTISSQANKCDHSCSSHHTDEESIERNHQDSPRKEESKTSD